MKNDDLDEIKYNVINENQDAIKKQENWAIAFGLQEVDNLFPSKYMVSLARENIEGIKTYDEVETELNTYYTAQSSDFINKNEQEADEVSLRIVKLLNDNSFIFSIATYKQFHKYLFEGVDLGIDHKLIGEFRDCNITKSEPILNGETVQYANYSMIKETLEYDFEEERNQKYTTMTKEKQINRIADFTSRIWQVHPFREGNTRTTAVFIQKYLNSKGFNVDNTLFKDKSLYFRNALVRANYSNVKAGIEEDTSFLIQFFENLLDEKENVLDNSKLYLDNTGNTEDNEEER